MADTYRLVRVENNEARIRAEAALLANVFPSTDRYSFEYLHWQYGQNPDGEAIGFDAYAEDEIAAHYVTLPIQATICGKHARGVLSLNTATHPNHQGKGLFTRLAEATYSLARELGAQFVVGVANANSTPGFTRKLNFQLISPLDAHIGIGSVETLDAPTDFSRLWSPDARRWRLRNPSARYFTDGRVMYSSSQHPLVRAQLTTSCWEAPAKTRSALPLTVWLGLEPRRKWHGVALPIPKRMRPSPLNLIFRDLTGNLQCPDAARVAWCAMDFDAY